MIKEIEIPQGTMRFETISKHNTVVSFTPHDDHPWLTNLRDMMKMLDDEIKIPHSTYFDSRGLGINSIPCGICTRAVELRSLYLSSKQKGIQ